MIQNDNAPKGGSDKNDKNLNEKSESELKTPDEIKAELPIE